MKVAFIIFASVVLSVYIIGNVYMYVRGYQLLEYFGRNRVWFTWIFWTLALSFIVTQTLRMTGVSNALFDAAFVVGSFWIAVMLYGFVIALTVDVLRFFVWLFNIRINTVLENFLMIKAVSFGIICVAMTIILTVGYKNAKRPLTTHLTIPIEKSAGHLSSLRIVMISDIHLGHIYGMKELARIVEVINAQNPDIVLLAGDIIDASPKPIIEKDMGVEFGKLQSKYGTFLAVGNHEYIGDRENSGAKKEAMDYLATHGVRMLLDTVALLDNSFYIAGRNDRSAPYRKTITDLLQGVNPRLPIILLDHQPYNLQEAEEAGIDLQLSGHTHSGQMWPVNYITGWMFEQDWGFLQKGKTNYYISCGVGTWGPPVRTAGYSEVVVVDLKFVPRR